MEPLLKITSVPLQTVHFNQNARLVPADSLDLERRKTMARYFAFQSRWGGSIDFGNISQVNKVFATAKLPDSLPSPGSVAKEMPPLAPNGSLPARTASMPKPAAAGERPGSAGPPPEKSPGGPVLSRPVQEAVIPEPQAAYTMQRGSFEMRVAKGELAYIPPLVMTIITQYPEIHFEYTGDDYPLQETVPSEANVDLSI